MNQPPAIKDNDNLRVEEYIKDWNWDEASHEFALQMGTFLLEFIDSLHTSGVSCETFRKHKGNCWLIGSFECVLWPSRRFHARRLSRWSRLFLRIQAQGKRDSKYAIASYKSTWRKIEKYVRLLAPKNT